MKNFNIVFPDGNTIQQLADTLKVAGDVASFFTVDPDLDSVLVLVGVARGWAVIHTDDVDENLNTPAPEPERERPTVAEAEAATRAQVMKGRAQADEPVYVDETDQLIADAEAHAAKAEHLHDPSEGPLEDAVGDHEEDIIAGRIEPDQTSEPDAPGVSTDPAPDQEQADVDATPTGDEVAESTGDDDPPAATSEPVSDIEDYEHAVAGDPIAEPLDRDVLHSRLASIYARQSKTDIMVAFVGWAGERRMQVNLNRMTPDELADALVWFEEQGITPEDPK